MTTRQAPPGCVAKVLAIATLLAAPALSSPARADSLSDHAFANVAASPSFEPDTPSRGLSAGWRNVYTDGGTFVTATQVRGQAGYEKYRLIQEFDNPQTGVERFEAAVAMNVRSGPFGNRQTSVAFDYFAGSVAHFGFDGPVRRFDLYARYAQTPWGHFLEMSPTYTVPIDARGRTAAWISLTLDGPLGTTLQRYGDVAAGLTRQAGPRLRLALSATQLRSRDGTGYLRGQLDLNFLARVSPW